MRQADTSLLSKYEGASIEVQCSPRLSVFLPYECERVGVCVTLMLAHCEYIPNAVKQRCSEKLARSQEGRLCEGKSDAGIVPRQRHKSEVELKQY